jgi:hypothetical protein
MAVRMRSLPPPCVLMPPRPSAHAPQYDSVPHLAAHDAGRDRAAVWGTLGAPQRVECAETVAQCNDTHATAVGVEGEGHRSASTPPGSGKLAASCPLHHQQRLLRGEDTTVVLVPLLRARCVLRRWPLYSSLNNVFFRPGHRRLRMNLQAPGAMARHTPWNEASHAIRECWLPSALRPDARCRASVRQYRSTTVLCERSAALHPPVPRTSARHPWPSDRAAWPDLRRCTCVYAALERSA